MMLTVCFVRVMCSTGGGDVDNSEIKKNNENISNFNKLYDIFFKYTKASDIQKRTHTHTLRMYLFTFLNKINKF